MPNVTQQQMAADARRRAAMMAQADPEAAQYLAAASLGSQKTVFNLPYWSTIRIRSVRTGGAGGPYTYTVASGVRKAFATKVGGVGDAAGFASGTVITEAETNLLNENNTRNNESLSITGISAEVEGSPSPQILAHIYRNAYIAVQLGTDSQIPLGKLSFFPQAGGAFGAAVDPLTLPAIAESGFVRPFASNGNPQNANYFKLDVPIQWNGLDKGADTNFNIILDLKQSLAITTLADRAAAAGIQVYNFPADGALGTYVDITWRLHGTRTGARGVNV